MMDDDDVDKTSPREQGNDQNNQQFSNDGPSSMPSTHPVKYKNWRRDSIHCCWGDCQSDTRTMGPISHIYFLPFPKPGKIKDTMTDWEKSRAEERTQKTKRWLHACGRKYYHLL